MLYRDLGRGGVKISAITFGAMRWPSEEDAFRILNHGMDLGLNYVDASTGYVGGRSQLWTGAAVRARRKEIYVSSKCLFGQAPTADVVRAELEKSLKVMGLDYFDFYQLWGLGSLDVLKQARARGGTLEGLRKAQADGLLRHGVGFTFPGPAEVFRAAIDTGEFVSATVSYNLMDRREEENIAYAGAHGVGVIIMNPLAGGVLGLARNPDLGFLRKGDSSPAYGALRFLLANRNISTPIVGFRAVDEVDQAVAALEGVEALGEPYRRDLMRQMDAVKLIEGKFCTGCEYCKDCPHGVKIPKLMQAMRDFVLYGVPPERLGEWIWSKNAHEDPVANLNLCDECGTCEKTCPQHLAIIESIRRAKKAIAK